MELILRTSNLPSSDCTSRSKNRATISQASTQRGHQKNARPACVRASLGRPAVHRRTASRRGGTAETILGKAGETPETPETPTKRRTEVSQACLRPVSAITRRVGVSTLRGLPCYHRDRSETRLRHSRSMFSGCLRCLRCLAPFIPGLSHPSLFSAGCGVSQPYAGCLVITGTGLKVSQVSHPLFPRIDSALSVLGWLRSA